MKKWYDEKHDLTIVYMNLPKDVDEVMTINSDCSYTAIINECCCPSKQLKAYRHILKHIENNDLEDGKDVQQIRKETHDE